MSSLRHFHQGSLRIVAFLVLDDGSCPAIDVLDEMNHTPKGRKLAGDIHAKLRYLSDNRSFPWLKQWEGDVYQFRGGKTHRVSTWTGHVGEEAVLVVLRVFHKHTDETSSHDANEIRRARNELEDLVKRSA